jgi:hypothetical protein
MERAKSRRGFPTLICNRTGDTVHKFFTLIMMLGLALGSFVTVGCERDTADRAGDAVEDSIRNSQDAVEDLGDDIEDATDELDD